MAPVVKRSLAEPTAGQPVEVPGHNETESGSHQLSIFNRVTEAAPVIGNVKVFLVFFYCLPCILITSRFFSPTNALFY